MAGKRVEVGPPFAGPPGAKGRGALRGAREERVADVRADFEPLRPDRGAEPRDDALRRHRHGLDGALDDARGDAAPAAVRDADDRAVAIREHERQAVGGEHGEDDVPRARDRRVRDRRRGRERGLRDVHRGAVHLRQPARRRREERLHAAAVLRHGGGIRGRSRRACGAEVERRVAPGADAAFARGRERGDAVHRHGPRGLDARQRAHCERARKAASSAAKSAGGGASHCTCVRVSGWTRPSRAACSAWRGNGGNAAVTRRVP